MDGQDRQDRDGIFTLTPALSLDGRGSEIATSLDKLGMSGRSSQ